MPIKLFEQLYAIGSIVVGGLNISIFLNTISKVVDQAGIIEKERFQFTGIFMTLKT